MNVRSRALDAQLVKSLDVDGFSRSSGAESLTDLEIPG
jgi:hypothetical protein